MAADDETKIWFALKRGLLLIKFSYFYFSADKMFLTSTLSLKKKNLLESTRCSLGLQYVPGSFHLQQMKAQTVQPHFAEIKQEGLTLIALQVCCYCMTCIDGFEIYWQAAWLSELNPQLAVPSDCSAFTRSPFAQMKMHRNPCFLSLFQAKNVPSAKHISI